jgi:hypothetical protein
LSTPMMEFFSLFSARLQRAALVAVNFGCR